MAKFQNNLSKLEGAMLDNVGVNNERVFPKISKRGRSLAMLQQVEEEKPTVTEELEIISKPVRVQMNE